MPNQSILILNPKGNGGNRTSLNRTRRYLKKGTAAWVIEGISIRFLDTPTIVTVPTTPTGPRLIHPARFTITAQNLRSVNLRTCTPIWPSQQRMKEIEGREERLTERKRKREATGNAL